MQGKTTRLIDISAQVGPSIHKEKTKVTKVNTTSTEPVLLECSLPEEVESFTYLGCIINVQGGKDENVKTRIGKARTGHLSYNFKQSGNQENCPNAPRSGFSTQM